MKTTEVFIKRINQTYDPMKEEHRDQIVPMMYESIKDAEVLPPFDDALLNELCAIKPGYNVEVQFSNGSEYGIIKVEDDVWSYAEYVFLPDQNVELSESFKYNGTLSETIDFLLLKENEKQKKLLDN